MRAVRQRRPGVRVPKPVFHLRRGQYRDAERSVWLESSKNFRACATWASTRSGLASAGVVSLQTRPPARDRTSTPAIRTRTTGRPMTDSLATHTATECTSTSPSVGRRHCGPRSPVLLDAGRLDLPPSATPTFGSRPRANSASSSTPSGPTFSRCISSSCGMRRTGVRRWRRRPKTGQSWPQPCTGPCSTRATAA